MLYRKINVGINGNRYRGISLYKGKLIKDKEISACILWDFSEKN